MVQHRVNLVLAGSATLVAQRVFSVDLALFQPTEGLVKLAHSIQLLRDLETVNVPFVLQELSQTDRLNAYRAVQELIRIF